ncbi:hypothetical protein H4Q26_013749 [Puccinia striiformis f. sp. tritici PST-130]|nr:hypothetical protein H4Q26_013749 [Puccinia striiformis f. sp. tritici PST-130]
MFEQPALSHLAKMTLAIAAHPPSIFDIQSATIQSGDTVIVYQSRDNLTAIVVTPGKKLHTRYGEFPHSDMIGVVFGSKCPSRKGNGFTYLLRPTPELCPTASDTNPIPSRYILHYISAGYQTRIICHRSRNWFRFVFTLDIPNIGPRGRLFSFEFHEERHAKAAAEFEAHGLLSSVGGPIQLAHRNVIRDGFGDIDVQVDSVFLDLPAPWDALEESKRVMNRSQLSRICCFSPCIEQVQKTCQTLELLGFSDIIMFETLVRTHEPVSVTMPKVDDAVRRIKEVETKKQARRERQISESKQRRQITQKGTNSKPGNEQEKTLKRGLEDTDITEEPESESKKRRQITPKGTNSQPGSEQEKTVKRGLEDTDITEEPEPKKSRNETCNAEDTKPAVEDGKPAAEDTTTVEETRPIVEIIESVTEDTKPLEENGDRALSEVDRTAMEIYNPSNKDIARPAEIEQVKSENPSILETSKPAGIAKLTASWSPASGFAVLERPSQVRSLTSVDVAEYQRSFEESNYRVILLDHDGVMKPVEGFPTEDHENSCEVLEKLASNPKNEVWIISGKKLSNLQEKYGHIPNLNLAGELGTDILAAKGKLAPILPEIYSNTETLLQEVLKLAESKYDIHLWLQYNSISKTCFIPFKHYIVFRYPQDDPSDRKDIEWNESLIKQKAFNDFELVTYPGSVFSALIHRSCNKGLLAEKLIERQTHLDTIGLSIGDQYIDEPMHILMRSRGFLSVIVTKHEEQETYARNKLSDHREVYNLLKALSNY